MKKIFSVMLVLASATAMAQTFSTLLKTDRKPWTGIPTFAGNDYKFVVLPDKTGGDETGAFELAIEEINRLAPGTLFRPMCERWTAMLFASVMNIRVTR